MTGTQASRVQLLQHHINAANQNKPQIRIPNRNILTPPRIPGRLLLTNHSPNLVPPTLPTILQANPTPSPSLALPTPTLDQSQHFPQCIPSTQTPTLSTLTKSIPPQLPYNLHYSICLHASYSYTYSYAPKPPKPLSYLRSRFHFLVPTAGVLPFLAPLPLYPPRPDGQTLSTLCSSPHILPPTRHPPPNSSDSPTSITRKWPPNPYLAPTPAKPS